MSDVCNEFGMTQSCSHQKGHKGPHSWAPDWQRSQRMAPAAPAAAELPVCTCKPTDADYDEDAHGRNCEMYKFLVKRPAKPALAEPVPQSEPELVIASRDILEACYQADAREELPHEITGEMIDALRAALMGIAEIPAGARFAEPFEKGRYGYDVAAPSPAETSQASTPVRKWEEWALDQEQIEAINTVLATGDKSALLLHIEFLANQAIDDARVSVSPRAYWCACSGPPNEHEESCQFFRNRSSALAGPGDAKETSESLPLL